MPKQALVVFNPVAKAGEESERWLGKIAHELFEQVDHVVTFFPTDPGKTPHDLIPLLAPPIDLVIAAGGDGTTGFALAALAEAGSPIPAGIIPLGTINVLARNLGIVEESFFADPLADAFSAITSGSPMKIDLGMMNGHYFAVTAGTGPMSDAFVLPLRAEKSNFKLFAYAKAMIESIATPPIIFRITMDGRAFTVEASGVFVSNVEDLGLGRPTDIGRLSDGQLALNILNPKNFRDYVEIGFRFAGGYVDGNPPHYVRMIEEVLIEVLPVNGRASSLQISGRKLKTMLTGQTPPSRQRRDIIAMIDGDKCGTTPMRVKVVPKAVNVLVPPKKWATAGKEAAAQRLPPDAA